METAVPPIILRHQAELHALCERQRVRRLALFGSAALGQFDPTTSDLDMLVEFEAMPPVEYADSFFGLTADLEGLIGLPIDLIERAPIRNPVFLRTITRDQVILYDAA